MLFALRWHPVGFGITYKACIIAEDTDEANYFWNKFRKKNDEVRDTWERAFSRTQGYTTFHPAQEWEEIDFRFIFPRKRKAGVYLCNCEKDNSPSDHLND